MEIIYKFPKHKEIIEGSRKLSYKFDQVSGTIRYLARSGTWHDLVPGTTWRSGTWHDQS